MKTKIKSYGDEVPDIYDREIPEVDSNHIVCIGLSPPTPCHKNTTPFFLVSPPQICKPSKPPFLGNPTYILLFRDLPPLKIGFFGAPL